MHRSRTRRNAQIAARSAEERHAKKITRVEAFEIGWQLNGALRHCQDGRDLARVLTAEGCEKISDLGHDIGILPLDDAMVLVKRRITERLNEQG